MKKLSQFEDMQAIIVASKLMTPIMNILTKLGDKKTDKLSIVEYVSLLIQVDPESVMRILEILDEKEPGEYHCNGVTVLRDAYYVFNDKALLELFGLQSETQASSTSASTTGEAVEG